MSGSIEEIQKILKDYLETLKNVQYTPLIYKLSSLEPKDIYELFFNQDENYNFTGMTSVESFILVFNLLFIDINILYTFIYKQTDDQRETSSIKEILNSENVENLIIDDTEKVYKKENSIVNIINTEKENVNVINLINKYNIFTENNIYFKNTMFLSLKNFIKIMYLLSNDKIYTNKEIIIKIFLYIISKYNKFIIDYINVYNKFTSGQNIDYNNMIKKIDTILYNYSTENVLTFLKLRSDNNNDYNTRFQYSLYPHEGKYKIMRLLYNDDDIQYYNNGKPFDLENPNYKYLQDSYGVMSTQYNYIINNYKYSYIFGPLTQIYDYKQDNKEISENMDIVIKLLLKKKPVFILGYGASGSGKTSTLIYFNKGKNIDQQNGILVHLCNLMATTHGFKKIKLKCREVFVNENGNPDVRYFPGDKDNKDKNLEFLFDGSVFNLKTDNNNNNQYIYENIYKNKSYPDTQTIFDNNTNLGQIIVHLIDKDRFVAATTNNPNSSRSHSLIFVTLIKGEDNGTQTESKIIIGDFAGVENLFDCDSEDFQNKFNDVERDNFNSSEEKEKIKKIEEKIKTLENEIKNPNDSNDPKNTQLNDLKNKLKLIIEEKRYYYRYPEIPSFDITKQKFDDYKLSLEDIYDKSKIYKIKKYLQNNKYLYKFDFISIKSFLINPNEYDNNTDKYIEKIIKTSSKDIIINSYKNLINKLKLLIISKNNSFPDVSGIELLLLKAILGINYDENSLDDKINIDVAKIKPKLGQEPYIQYINKKFEEKDDKYQHAKYTVYFIERFNILKDKYNKGGKEKLEKEKKLKYGKEICNIRRKEGVFINESLNHVRDIINYIIYKKNEKKLTISPPFIDKCLNFYCEQDICFNTKKDNIYDTYTRVIKQQKFDIEQKKPFNSIIFNIIADELKNDIFNIIISVFCVFNISKTANNPPPVPYISINKLKYYHYNKIYDKVEPELKKILCDYNKNQNYDDSCKLNNYDEKKINNILNNDTFKNINANKSIILSQLKDNNDTEKNYYNHQIKSLFKLFNNFNSASAIGTLEFVDSLAKYNTINSICETEYP
jgi:hypothetical protein